MQCTEFRVLVPSFFSNDSSESEMSDVDESDLQIHSTDSHAIKKLKKSYINKANVNEAAINTVMQQVMHKYDASAAVRVGHEAEVQALKEQLRESEQKRIIAEEAVGLIE